MHETPKTARAKKAVIFLGILAAFLLLSLGAFLSRASIANVLYGRALGKASSGDLGGAIASANWALWWASNDQVCDVLYIRAGFKEGQRDWEGAIADFTRIIKRDPSYKHYSAPLGRGMCLTRLRRWEEALSDFTQVLTDDPTLAFAAFQLGKTFEAKGDRSSAVAAYNRSLTMGGLDPVFRREVEERLQRLR